jgi:molybdopterin converting factor small subunit
MIEKQNEALKKKDLDVILEVNKKAIEIETEVAEQNEEIIDALNKSQENQNAIIKRADKIIDSTNSINNTLYRIQVLFISGFVTIILAVISMVVQIFVKK